MKKIFLTVLYFISSLILFILSNSFYTDNNKFLGAICLFFGFLFTGVFITIIGRTIIKEFDKSKKNLVSLINLILLIIVYILYVVIVYNVNNYYIIQLFLNLMYMLFITLIAVSTINFWSWFKDSNKLYNFRFIIITPTIIITFIACTTMLKGIGTITADFLSMLYNMAVIEFAVYILTFVGYKLIKPSE